jgi:predicted transcriptional regulator
MQVNPARELLWMFIERIVSEVFAKETGASRLQQIGLFTLIYAMQRDPPVTAARIAELTGQSQSQIHRQLKKLLHLKLVERRPILNQQGRGRAYELLIKHTKQTERLVKAIDKASKRQK